MKAWFNNLVPREQWVVLIGGVIIAVLLIYVALWNPLSTTVSDYQNQVRSQQQLLAYMQQAAAHIQALKASGIEVSVTQGDLLTVAEQTLAEKKLSVFLKQVQQPQHDQIDLIFEKVPFDQLIAWVQTLSAHDDVQVLQLSATRLPLVGTADVKIVLGRQL